VFSVLAETGKNIAYNYTVTCSMCAVRYIMQDTELGYKSSGIRSPMAIGWLFLEHSHQHKL
jgi:hypothetical protein